MERALCLKRPEIKSQLCYSLAGRDLDVPLTSLNLQYLIHNTGLIIMSITPSCCKIGTRSVVIKSTLHSLLVSQHSWILYCLSRYWLRSQRKPVNKISAFKISWPLCGEESHKQILKYKMWAITTAMCTKSSDCKKKKNKWMPRSKWWENKVAEVNTGFLEEVMPEMAFEKRIGNFLAQRWCIIQC